MKNFYAYIVKNNAGNILDPNFVSPFLAQVTPIKLLTKDEAYSKDIFEFMRLIQTTQEDSELTIAWYIRGCELTGQVPEKLHPEKIQITVIEREI